MGTTWRNIFGASLLAAFALAGGTASAAVVSTFDADNEGWTTLELSNDGSAVLGGVPSSHVATGGNPGGFLTALDPGDETAARFSAPAKFLGDQSAYLGGTLSFDLALSPASAAIAPVPALVVFMNETANLALGFVGLASPPETFSPYVVTLAADGASWRAFVPGSPAANIAATATHFETVFAGLTHLSITGEFLDDIDDTVSLDNVVMSAVPVPAALPLLAVGLGIAGAAARRRRAG